MIINENDQNILDWNDSMGLYQNEIKNSPKKRKTGSSTYVQDPVFVV